MVILYFLNNFFGDLLKTVKDIEKINLLIRKKLNFNKILLLELNNVLIHHLFVHFILDKSVISFIHMLAMAGKTKIVQIRTSFATTFVDGEGVKLINSVNPVSLETPNLLRSKKSINLYVEKHIRMTNNIKLPFSFNIGSFMPKDNISVSTITRVKIDMITLPVTCSVALKWQELPSFSLFFSIEYNA